jgi:hypothetical protein
VSCRRIRSSLRCGCARALVTTTIARVHIPILADALLGYGTLSGDQMTALLTKQDNLIHWVMKNCGHTLDEAIVDLKGVQGAVKGILAFAIICCV